MATAPKPIPVPWESFQPGATEQTFARGALDRDMSGLSLMMMNAAQNQREANHVQYSAGVDEANKQAREQFAREQAQAAMLKQLEVAAGLAKEGFLPSGMPAMAGVMTDPKANDDIGQLMRQKMLSEIGKNNASAAAGGDTYSVEYDTTPQGVGNATYKAKGKNLAALQAEIEKRIQQDRAARGLPPTPAGQPMALPTSRENADKARAAAKARYPGQ